MSEFIQLSIYMVSLAALTSTYIYYRRNRQTEKTFAKTLEKTRLMKAEYLKIRGQTKHLKNQVTELNEEKTKRDKRHKDVFDKINELSDEIQKKDLTIVRLNRQIASHSENALAQARAYETQLRDLQTEKETIRHELKTAEDKTLANYLKKIESLESKVNSLKETNKSIDFKTTEKEREIEKLRTKLSENTAISPDELLKYKKRAHRANHFFNTMRGQKEMAEERYRNWEVALEILSSWVLVQKGVKNIPAGIGPQVGEALAAINKEDALGDFALDSEGDDELAAMLSYDTTAPFNPEN